MEPRHEKMLAASRRNVSRLRLLIDDLLTLSRAEARDTEMVPVDLGLLIARGRDRRPDHRGPPRDRIEVDVPADVVVRARRPADAAPGIAQRGQQRGEVQPRGRRRRGLPVAQRRGASDVVVRDHGIGIPAAELDRLGTRFFRASNAVTNEIAGTGLGVRIVQTIVDKHGGHVVIDSGGGRGHYA